MCIGEVVFCGVLLFGKPKVSVCLPSTVTSSNKLVVNLTVTGEGYSGTVFASGESLVCTIESFRSAYTLNVDITICQ